MFSHWHCSRIYSFFVLCLSNRVLKSKQRESYASSSHGILTTSMIWQASAGKWRVSSTPRSITRTLELSMYCSAKSHEGTSTAAGREDRTISTPLISLSQHRNLHDRGSTFWASSTSTNTGCLAVHYLYIRLNYGFHVTSGIIMEIFPFLFY